MVIMPRKKDENVCSNAVKFLLCFCSQADWVIDESKPASNWPERGAVSFKTYSTRYREGLDLVLKDISCDIHPGEKVG